MTCQKIGGEFEINPSYLLQGTKEFDHIGFLFSSGRIALHAILSSLKKDKKISQILLPEYLCKSIIKTAQNNHFKIFFYKLNTNLDLDKQSFPKGIKDSAVLVINYFGLKNTSDDITYIKSKTCNCPIILDNVQAFFEMFNENNADFAFSSFRKFFPIPDGGWLKVKDGNFHFEKLIGNSLFSTKKLLGGLIKYFSSNLPIDDEIYLKFLEEGENELDKCNAITGISKESLSILSNIKSNFEEIISVRNTNSIFILEQLKSLEIETLFPINSLINAPLVIPIKLRQRDIIRNRMFENKIYLPIHWSIPSNFFGTTRLSHEIAQKELSLVIDQRYTPSILQRVIEVFYKCKEDKLL